MPRCCISFGKIETVSEYFVVNLWKNRNAMKPRIFLSYVHMGGTERDWVEEAFRSEWIVPLGPNVDEFEHRLESYLGANHVVALSAECLEKHLGYSDESFALRS